jgi:acyl-CoA thioesterase I
MNKKALYSVGVGVVFILVGLLLFKGKESMVKNYPSSGADIVAFGDSLVEGVGASTDNKNFVSRLSEKAGVPIVNLGVSGNTTADGLARISELDKYKPKVVLLLLGGNDRLRSVPLAQTVNNLNSIIENIQSRGAIVILLGVKGNLLGDKFGGELEKISKKYQTAYVPDVLDDLFGNAKFMSDSIHPNDAGYEIIAIRIHPVLTGLIK